MDSETETAVETSSELRPGTELKSTSASRISGSSPRHTWAFESTCAWTRQFVVLLRRGLELFSISDAFRTFSSSSRTRNNLWRHTRKVTSHDAMISNRLSSQACPILIGGSFLSDLDKIEKRVRKRKMSEKFEPSRSRRSGLERVSAATGSQISVLRPKKKFGVYFEVASEDEKQHDTGLHGGDFCLPFSSRPTKRNR